MSDQISKHSLVSRRQFLSVSGATIAALSAAGLLPGLAFASVEEAETRIKELVGEKKIQEGKVSIKLPKIAENGNTVPVTVTVDSPMTEENHVTAIHMLAEKNPAPDIASFQLSSASGKAEISTRVRLAKTQNVVAIAQMNDGSVYIGKQAVKVTIGGCGG